MMVFNMLFNLISTVMSPTISRLYVSDRKRLIGFLQMYLLVCLSIGILSSVFLFVSSNWVVKVLFGKQYVDTIYLLKVWALGLLPLTPLSIFSISSLIACDGSKQSALSIAVGTIVSLVSVLILVRTYGVVGAPFSHVLMELSVTIVGGYFLLRKLNPTKEEFIMLFNLKSAAGRSCMWYTISSRSSMRFD